MTLKYWLGGVVGAMALGMLSLSAQAASLGSAAEGVRANAAENSMVQEARWYRRCWWHRGHRHCRRVWRRWGGYPYHQRHYGYGYGGPAIYGPGFSFYFGPRRHYGYW